MSQQHPRTVRELERDREAAIYAALDEALGWEPGAFDWAQAIREMEENKSPSPPSSIARARSRVLNEWLR